MAKFLESGRSGLSTELCPDSRELALLRRTEPNTRAAALVLELASDWAESRSPSLLASADAAAGYSAVQAAKFWGRSATETGEAAL